MSAVPNLPSLSANGSAAKNYDSNRTVSRLYSAKTVYFYKEGDEFFQGVRVPVSKHRYRTLESLLDDLNEKVPLYFGVRRVFTPTGKREVHSIDELQNLGRYVCASSKWTKGLTAAEHYQQWKQRPFENERTLLQKRHRSYNSSINSPQLGKAAPAVAAAETTKARITKRLVANTQTPIPLLHDPNAGQKQVLFALNGMPNRVYRMKFRTRRLPQFDDVLTELSEMLHAQVAKLYTPDGHKLSSVADILAHGHAQLLACQRHEKPTAAGKLPPITISNGSPVRKQAPRRLARSPVKESKLKAPGPSTIQPLPQITSSSAATATSDIDKQAAKRIRRRTISKRKRKKVTDTATAAGDDSSLAEKHEAAVKIQATFRGFRARKKLEARTRPPEDYDSDAHRAAVVIQAGMKGFLARKRYRVEKSRASTTAVGSDVVETPIDALDIDAISNAAAAIQASFRGYAARKRMHNRKKMEAAGETCVNGKDDKRNSSKPEIATEAPKLIAATERSDKVRSKLEKKADGGTKKKRKKKQIGDCTYRISIYVGNRWAADSDTDIYVILHGEQSDSKKLVLKQSAEEPRFQQNQMDSFDVEAPYVGLLKKITVGHENRGYGAGIYIDRVVVTEVQTDSLQYFFPCAKWIDSGQVDGKLDRICPCAGYQKLSEQTAAVASEGGEAQLPTKGRWTIRLHVERAVPEKFKTRLFLTAYGTFGRSEMIALSDDFEVAEGAECSFNVEFGDLGELFKMRYDAEQTVSQAWLLKWVDMKDVDTGEEMRMNVNKWFCQRVPDDSKLANPQTFREIAVLKIGIDPLPTFQYTVTLQVSNNRNGCASPVYAQLTGEFGDSGLYPLPIAEGKNEQEIQVTIESVSLGRLMFVSVTAPLTERGEVYSESFRALQEIYDRHGIRTSVAPDWIIKMAIVRESPHAPYQFIFGESRIVEPDTAGSLKKQLTLTDMEGLTTMAKIVKAKVPKGEKAKGAKLSKRDAGVAANGPASTGQWRVFVSTGEHADGGTDCTPYLTVYGDSGVSKPIPLLDKKQLFTPGSVCQFDVDLKGVGRIFKVRVRLDTSGPNPMWYLKRMKMKDLSTGDELRFPVEMWLEKSDDNPEVSVELPAVWPDVPPLPSVLYNVTLCTGTNSDNDTDFDVYLIIFGEKGDTGKRFLRSPVGTQDSSCLKPGNVDTFELEAVSVRKILRVQIGLEPRKKSASWYLERVEILDPECEQLYTFQCAGWFSDSKEDRKLERTLVPASVAEDGAV